MKRPGPLQNVKSTKLLKKTEQANFFINVGLTNLAAKDIELVKHPTDIIIYACALMSYWAGLYGADMQSKILEGVKILVSCVHKVMAQQRRPSPRLLLDTREDTSEDDA